MLRKSEFKVIDYKTLLNEIDFCILKRLLPIQIVNVKRQID